MRHIAPLGCAGLALLLSACGGSPSSSPVAAALPARSAPETPAAVPAKPAGAEPQPAGSMIETPALPDASGPKYDPKGRRDPFEALDAVEGPANASVASARLTGIVRKTGGPALALIETADGLGYIVQLGDMFGDGRLVEIGPDTVVFTVAPRRGAAHQRVILKLGD